MAYMVPVDRTLHFRQQIDRDGTEWTDWQNV